MSESLVESSQKSPSGLQGPVVRNTAVDSAVSDKDKENTGLKRQLPLVSGENVTKKIKLFTGNFDDDDEVSEEVTKDSEVVDNTELDKVIPNDQQETNNTLTESKSLTTGSTVYKDDIPVPADSELLKKNEALENYTEYVQDNSMFPQQSYVHQRLANIPLNLPAPHYIPQNIQLLINTLPSLDNFATQILRVIVENPYQKILDLVANPETLAGMTYQTLISLFEHIKSMYSTEDPFLSVEHLTFGLWKEDSVAPTFFRGKEDTVISTLRKVNLATFLNATLGTIDTGFFYLNESFLDVFCPDLMLNPAQTITNLSSAAADVFDIATLSSHSMSSSLGKLLKSQTVLYLELKTQAYISALESHERSREEILNDIFPDNLDEILLKRKLRFLTNSKEKPTLIPSELDFIGRCKKRKENLLLAGEDEDLSEQYDWLTFLKDFFEFSRKHIGYLVWGTTKNTTETIKTSKREIKPVSSTTASPLPVQDGEFKYDPDSLPSEIVQNHRESTYSNSNVKHLSRRLWTKAEEQALKEALQLKGPQWSQILDLHGAGGAISEALKNRTQVQLKDKARNWKIFFLKNGLPLPDYLKNVTGDLESNKNGGKRGKKITDSKRINKPPRIEQKHVDAAAAAAANAETDEAKLSSELKLVESLKITDETNVFAQGSSSENTEQPVESEKPTESEKITKSSDLKNEDQQKSDEHHDDEEMPDYDNILKDLIDQATTNSDNTHNHETENRVDEDVQRLVDEVINANSEEEKKKDDNDDKS